MYTKEPRNEDAAPAIFCSAGIPINKLQRRAQKKRDLQLIQPHRLNPATPCESNIVSQGRHKYSKSPPAPPCPPFILIYSEGGLSGSGRTPIHDSRVHYCDASRQRARSHPCETERTSLPSHASHVSVAHEHNTQQHRGGRVILC